MDSDNTPSQEASEAAELLPTVTQRAREAAADLHAVDLGEPLSEADWFYLNEIRAGRNDEDDGVQAFARYERDTLARQQTGGGEEHVTWEKALLDQFYIGPWVVCDATDEVFLSDGAWREDIWEASTHSRETAEELALKHGGADHPEIRAWPYARFDKPTEWRLLEENAKLRAALSAPPTDETAQSADVPVDAKMPDVLHRAQLASLDSTTPPADDALSTMQRLGQEYDGEPQYLIRKGGYYYRPNCRGYTTSIAEAGRYTLEQAIKESHPNGPDGPRDEMSYELAPPIQPVAPADDGGLRSAKYASFTDGMEAAAEICGTLAETTYDDSDGFAAATGCEAAIMRVVREQRAEQAKIGESQ